MNVFILSEHPYLPGGLCRVEVYCSSQFCSLGEAAAKVRFSPPGLGGEISSDTLVAGGTQYDKDNTAVEYHID